MQSVKNCEAQDRAHCAAEEHSKGHKENSDPAVDDIEWKIVYSNRMATRTAPTTIPPIIRGR